MSLAQTIARLRANAMNAGANALDPASNLAGLTDFGANPGNLRGWVHIPGDLPRDRPLVVVLHGCTQTADGYDRGAGWSELADRHGFAVLLPEQTRANNANGCFNWFSPEDTRRGSGEARSIRDMIAAVVDRHAIDPSRVFVTGLSAGGAMTSVMLATYPDIFAGGGIIAGLPYGVASGVPQALERMRGQGGPRGAALGAAIRAASDHAGPWPTISVWHGSADPTVAPINAAMIVDQWRDVHGVDEPSVNDMIEGHPHAAWTDRSGRVVIEEYRITGMGHGTPLATTGADACGTTGPFMLEASISSTQRLAAAWDILDPLARGRQAAPRPEPVRTRAAANAPQFNPERIIEDALRAAGLFR